MPISSSFLYSIILCISCLVTHQLAPCYLWNNNYLVLQVYWVGPLAAGILASAFYRFVFGIPPTHQSAPQETDQGVPLTGVRGSGTDETNIKWNRVLSHNSQYDTTDVVFIRHYYFTEVIFYFFKIHHIQIGPYILDIRKWVQNL